MIITKKALQRRTFLRGMGATVALPLLDAMVPSMTALAQTPANPVRRLGFVYMPMGSDITRWTPPGENKLDDQIALILNILGQRRGVGSIIFKHDLFRRIAFQLGSSTRLDFLPQTFDV